MLQQPHFHVGSHVTQVKCCCFSPDGSTILSGSWDNTLKLWRTRDGLCNSTLSGVPSCGPDSSILDIATLIERDVRSFLEKPTGVPICSATLQVIDVLCDSSATSFSFRSSGIQILVSQLEIFCSKSTQQLDELNQKHYKLQCTVDESNHEVHERVEQVEVLRKQLVEAEKQLASSQQKHHTLVEEEHKCSEEHKICAVKTEELIKCRDFYKGELDKTRSVMNQLSSKLKESRDVSCLTQAEVLLFLQELDIPKPIRDSFQKNQIGGKALKLVSDRILRELGMSDINQRKGLLHSICNVRAHGCIHVAPPVGACGDGLAAWWSADEVWKWLEEQGFSFPCLKGLTGRTLIHLSDKDITQFGLPIGPALELKEKCETLKQSFFSFVHQQRESLFLLFVDFFDFFQMIQWMAILPNLYQERVLFVVFHQTVHQNSFVRFHKKS